MSNPDYASPYRESGIKAHGVCFPKRSHERVALALPRALPSTKEIKRIYHGRAKHCPVARCTELVRKGSVMCIYHERTGRIYGRIWG